MVNQNNWKEVFELLDEWAVPGFTFDYEEIEDPPHEIVLKIKKWAVEMCGKNEPVPFRVVPDGENGICAEYREKDNCFKSIEFNKDGTIEVLEFKDHKLVNRYNMYV